MRRKREPAHLELHPEGEFYKELLDNLSDGVYIVDTERRITYWNHGAERISGYRSGEVVGHLCFENLLQHVDGDGCQLCHGACPLAGAIGDGAVREAEVYLRHRQGHRVPVWVRVTPIKDREGKIVGAVEVFDDNSSKVAALKKIEELEDMALLDPLTGIGNRRYCEVALSDRLNELRRYGWSFGLLFLDIDGFKAINDLHGHEAGDRVLAMVANTLLASTRSNDFLGRWGGEEFLLLLSNATEDRLARIADRFRRLVGTSSLPHGESSLCVTVSVGATLGKVGESVEEAMRRADQLLYASKRSGRDRVTVG